MLVKSLIEENERMTVEIMWLRKQFLILRKDMLITAETSIIHEEALLRADLLCSEEHDLAKLDMDFSFVRENLQTVSFLRPILDQLAALRFDTVVFSRIQRVSPGDEKKSTADDVKGFFQKTLDEANAKFDQMYVSVASMQRTSLSRNVFVSLVLDCYSQIIALSRTMNALHFEKIECEAAFWSLLQT